MIMQSFNYSPDNPKFIAIAAVGGLLVSIFFYLGYVIVAGAIVFALFFTLTSPQPAVVETTPDIDEDPALDQFWKKFENNLEVDEIRNRNNGRADEKIKDRGLKKDDTTDANELNNLDAILGGDDDDLTGDEDDDTMHASAPFGSSWADETMAPWQPGEGDLNFVDSCVPSAPSDEGPKDDKRKGGGKNNEDKPKVHWINPRQVYIGGLPFRTTEEDLFNFFSSNCGPIDMVKLLRHPDGKSRGVAFVTFTTVESAHSALRYHDQDYEGRLLTVRITNPDQNKSEPKKKWPNYGGGKGGPPKRVESDRNSDTSNTAAQAAAARAGRPELDKMLQAVVDVTPLELSDFDYQARKMLLFIFKRSPERCQDCLDSIKEYTTNKERSSVRNWKGYVYTLLHKQEPELFEEQRTKRNAKGGEQ